jgi:predicted HTH domain antitoxin
MATGTNTTLTVGIEEELAALVEAGHYDSEQEVLRDALEALLDANPELRVEMAIALWTNKKITLSRAVEIAQSNHESFKDEIAKRGLFIEVDMSADEVRREATQIPNRRPLA